MKPPARMVSPERRSDDVGVTALRPQQLSEFVGQQQARANLSIFIEAARKRGEGMTNAEGKSYVRRLLDKGVPKINAKIEEEAGELCAALAGESDAQVYAETADLLFHVLVGLSARDLRFEEVTRVLAGRLGVSGIDEKAGRADTSSSKT